MVCGWLTSIKLRRVVIEEGSVKDINLNVKNVKVNVSNVKKTLTCIFTSPFQVTQNFVGHYVGWSMEVPADISFELHCKLVAFRSYYGLIRKL